MGIGFNRLAELADFLRQTNRLLLFVWRSFGGIVIFRCLRLLASALNL
jgi:hypothetical protein